MHWPVVTAKQPFQVFPAWKPCESTSIYQALERALCGWEEIVKPHRFGSPWVTIENTSLGLLLRTFLPERYILKSRLPRVLQDAFSDVIRTVVRAPYPEVELRTLLLMGHDRYTKMALLADGMAISMHYSPWLAQEYQRLWSLSLAELQGEIAVYHLSKVV